MEEYYIFMPALSIKTEKNPSGIPEGFCDSCSLDFSKDRLFFNGLLSLDPGAGFKGLFELADHVANGFGFDLPFFQLFANLG